MNNETRDQDQALEVAARITDRIVSLITTIVWLALILVVGLISVYVWLVVNPKQDTSADLATARIESLVLNSWNQVHPLAASVLKMVGPVLVLFLGLALIGVLSRKGASPFDLVKITSDLPSLLALIIILSICLLPLGGLPVPDVLNNIALVVVGFYFGKRDHE